MLTTSDLSQGPHPPARSPHGANAHSGSFTGRVAGPRRGPWAPSSDPALKPHLRPSCSDVPHASLIPPVSPLPRNRGEASCGARGRTPSSQCPETQPRDCCCSVSRGWRRPPRDPPHSHPGRRLPAGNLHNILCKLISASDNDLDIAWNAEAAVTTLSNHILNYVSLYRKVLQKHTDMKSVCCSPTANHLTSFPAQRL